MVSKVFEVTRFLQNCEVCEEGLRFGEKSYEYVSWSLVFALRDAVDSVLDDHYDELVNEGSMFFLNSDCKEVPESEDIPLDECRNCSDIV